MFDVNSNDYLGMVVSWAGNINSLPPGWLACDGSAIPANYPLLSNLIGPNLPDLAGRTVIGAGTPFSATNSDGSDPNWGQSPPPSFTNLTSLGEFSHTLTIDEMPTHAHGNPMGRYNILVPDQGGEALFQDYTMNTETANSGGSNAHNNVQPSFVMNYIIYAGSSSNVSKEK